jgi:hypothetical protein
MGEMASDRAMVMTALELAGVTGLDDYGRFVNNTEYFAPSRFDEAAAYPVLLREFPKLVDHDAIATVARYLGHHRLADSAFSLLHDAFVRFAPTDKNLGWVLGDSLARRGSAKNLDQILELCVEPSYGTARQMLVYSTWKYKADDRVRQVLEQIVRDPDVSLQAMSALRRTLGNSLALPVLMQVRDNSSDELIRKQASDSVRRIERALAK